MSVQTYCQADIYYLGGEMPQPVTTLIRDGRVANTSVWEEGFELIRLPSAVTDWQNLKAIEQVHYNEVTQWAKTFTGCEAVLFFPALVRSPEAQVSSDDYAPILAAHSDYTEGYADMIKDAQTAYHKVLSPSIDRAGITSADVASAKRVLTLQLWRNTGPVQMDYPLAVCDCRTVGREELIPVTVESYGGVPTEFDAFGLMYSEAATNHHWYTFPNMEVDEVLLFRAFDSERVAQSKPFWTPHTAFKDPHSDGTPRSSVEKRAICLFW